MDAYTDPAGHYAFRTYDVTPLNKGGSLRAEDILAANLLSLRLGWQQVTPLFADRDDTPDPEQDGAKRNTPQDLLAAMNAALVDLRDAPSFEAIETESKLARVLTPLAAANEATRNVSGWTPVTVSKVLHRHLPHIVPLVDSRVREFYGVGSNRNAELRLRLWNDIRENNDWLVSLARKYRTPDGRPLSVLRLVDIIIWTPDP